MAIQNLAKHRSRFVTVVELAAYWLVSPQQIRHHIDAGALEAVRLGPRLYRVPVEAALRFERGLTRQPSTEADAAPARTEARQSKPPEKYPAPATTRPVSRRLALTRHG
jgi:hypothetical protein